MLLNILLLKNKTRKGMIIVRKTSTRTIFSSSWSRRKQAEMFDEWQIMAPESTLLGFIKEIAANCEAPPQMFSLRLSKKRTTRRLII